jgi:hypothetical protein
VSVFSPIEPVRGEPVVRFSISIEGKNSLVITPLWRGPLAPDTFQLAVFDPAVKISGDRGNTYFNDAVTFRELVVVPKFKRRAIIRIRRRGYLPWEFEGRMNKGKAVLGTLFVDLAYQKARRQ